MQMLEENPPNRNVHAEAKGKTRLKKTKRGSETGELMSRSLARVTAVPEGEEGPNEGGKEDLKVSAKSALNLKYQLRGSRNEVTAILANAKAHLVKFLEIRYKEQILEEIRGGEKKTSPLGEQ